MATNQEFYEARQKVKIANKATGVVKTFSAEKGYGFIATEDSQEIFVHWSAIQQQRGYKKLEEGQKVEFFLQETEKGLQANRVTVIEEEVKEEDCSCYSILE